MSEAPVDRDSEILRELAELGLMVARDLQARVAAAKDDATANQLARSFERVSRSVRHCLALEARLKDGFRRRAVEDREQAAEARRTEAVKYRAEVREAFERMILEDPEIEAYGSDYLLARADRRLEREMDEPRFLDLTVQQHVDRLRLAMRLDVDQDSDAAHKPPPGIDPLTQRPWRGSA